MLKAIRCGVQKKQQNMCEHYVLHFYWENIISNMEFEIRSNLNNFIEGNYQALFLTTAVRFFLEQ